MMDNVQIYSIDCELCCDFTLPVPDLQLLGSTLTNLPHPHLTNS